MSRTINADTPARKKAARQLEEPSVSNAKRISTKERCIACTITVFLTDNGRFSVYYLDEEQYKPVRDDVQELLERMNGMDIPPDFGSQRIGPAHRIAHYMNFCFCDDDRYKNIKGCNSFSPSFDGRASLVNLFGILVGGNNSDSLYELKQSPYYDEEEQHASDQ